MKNGILLVFFLHAAFIASNASLIEFYLENEYNGLIFRSRLNFSNHDCTSLPPQAADKVMSIKMKVDTCVILYDEPNCSGVEVKVYTSVYRNIEIGSMQPKSFQRCNNPISNGLYVSAYREPYFKDLVYEILDIQGQAVPSGRHGPISSMDTHEGCVKVCFVPYNSDADCLTLTTGNSRGYNFPARHVAVVRPCEGYLHDSWFTSSPFKFEILANPALAAVISQDKSVELAAKTTFRNNGSATVTQEYTAKRSITESIEISHTDNFKSTSSWSVENTLTIEVSASLKFFGKGFETTVSDSLKTAWSGSTESGSEDSETFRHEETREFAVNQKIEIPPCTNYEVSSYVEVTTNYPVDYIAYSRIRGEKSGNPIPLADIKTWISGKTDLEFVEDYDNATAIVKFKGRMIANFGVDSMIDGSGQSLLGCMSF